ncbi:MAG: hypothetical protein JWQ78_926 [Sediminibacterium sp.]|nr:hypothetical protein [Sediminibacterium sp.]
MTQEKKLTEQESLQLITEMIHKAKNNFHDSGTSAILWGSVVGIAGLVSFAERFWHFYIGFDIWLIVLGAFIPQIIISIREGKNRKVVTYEESSMNAIWLVYGISIFALNFYFNVVPAASDRILAGEGLELLLRNLETGKTEHYVPAVMSAYSLLLLIYAIPTLATGIARKFTPMVIGGILCYLYFIISCFTGSTYDLLLNGIAGISCWLVPGLVLRNRYLKAKQVHV